tara:strand:+ start:118 stop:591 length:474 start_codon:yes stop_codon:yes gene_type:complete
MEFYDNYLIYNSGDVYSIKSKKFLKPRFDRDGYKRVDLYKDNVAKTFFIHQLVAIVYKDYVPNNKLVIDHIDDNRTNNFLHNLQIITRQQNSRKIKYPNKKNGLPKGITTNKHKTKFYANIKIDGVKCYLGCSNNLIEAHDIYMKKYTELMIGVLNI